MTPEERSLLERTHKLAEENNEILHKIRRTSRLSLIFRGIYWLVIIGIALGAYYVIQPYVDSVLGLYQELFSNQSGVGTDVQMNGNPLLNMIR